MKLSVVFSATDSTAAPATWGKLNDDSRLRLADDSSVDGRIAACDDEGVDVVGRTTTRYPYDQITSALVQTELNRKDA